MTLQFVRFNTSEGKEIAIADVTGEVAETLVVLSETDVDGLTAGQLSFKHSVERGSEPGTFSH